MILEFIGSRYILLIINKDVDEDALFSIRAICQTTNLTSSINNLNPILNELNVNHTEARFEDSEWLIAKTQAEKFTRIISALLSSETYLNYLECKLDDDRNCGEWVNIWCYGEVCPIV